METTSFADHTLGLRGYRHLRTEYKGGVVLHRVEQLRGRRGCRGCGARFRELRVGERFVWTFCALPSGSKRQLVALCRNEQQCRQCALRLPVVLTWLPGTSQPVTLGPARSWPHQDVLWMLERRWLSLDSYSSCRQPRHTSATGSRMPPRSQNEQPHLPRNHRAGSRAAQVPSSPTGPTARCTPRFQASWITPRA